MFSHIAYCLYIFETGYLKFCFYVSLTVIASSVRHIVLMFLIGLQRSVRRPIPDLTIFPFWPRKSTKSLCSDPLINYFECV